MENIKIVNRRAGKDDKSKLPLYLSTEYRTKMGTLLKLTEEQEKFLKKRIKKELENWETDTDDLHRGLQEDYDLAEGNIPADYSLGDWVLQTDTGMTSGYIDIMGSVQERSILGADRIWMAHIDPEAPEILSDNAEKIEESFNYHAQNSWNIASQMKMLFYTTDRDGLGIGEIEHVEDYEPGADTILVENIEQFFEEFPDPESMGTSEKNYKRWVERVKREATEENPIEINIEFDDLKYKGPWLEVVDYVDFVSFPAHAREFELMRGYGKRYSVKKGYVRKKMEEGLWYKSACKKFLKHAENTDGNVPEYHANRDMVEGLTRTDKSDDHWIFKLTYKCRFPGDKKDSKLQLNYSKDFDILMSCIAYPYRCDHHYVFMRMKKKPNQQRGGSVPDATRDAHYENNDLHRLRDASRKIASIPTFKGPEELKSTFDPSLESNSFIPGRFFFFKSEYVDKVSPMIQGGRDTTGDTLVDERNNTHNVDIKLGANSNIMSGLPDAKDPGGPGNKMSMQIGQTNLRMDPMLMDMREGVGDIGNICLSHVYQFGPIQIPYMTEEPQQDGSVRQIRQTIPKRLLRRGIKLAMRGITVAMNPEGELYKGMQLHQFLLTDPAIAQDEEIRLNNLRRVLREGRVLDWQKRVPTAEQARQRMIAIQKMAMMQLMAEQAEAQKKAEEQKRTEAKRAMQDQQSIEKEAVRRAEEGLTV